MRPDASIGVRLFSNSSDKAQLLARFVKDEHDDWEVLIEPWPPTGERVAPVSNLTSPPTR